MSRYSWLSEMGALIALFAGAAGFTLLAPTTGMVVQGLLFLVLIGLFGLNVKKSTSSKDKSIETLLKSLTFAAFAGWVIVVCTPYAWAALPAWLAGEVEHAFLASESDDLPRSNILSVDESIDLGLDSPLIVVSELKPVMAQTLHPFSTVTNERIGDCCEEVATLRFVDVTKYIFSSGNDLTFSTGWVLLGILVVAYPMALLFKVLKHEIEKVFLMHPTTKEDDEKD